MPHRILAGDGDHSCYACGIVVETTSDSDHVATFDRVPCRPGGWNHPPYLMPFADDLWAPLIETCAAHPYAGCVIDAPILAAIGAQEHRPQT